MNDNMNDKKNGYRRSGFTLVEVLVALAILGIGILGVTVLFPRALRNTQRVSGMTAAAIYAETTADRLRAQGYRGVRYEAELYLWEQVEGASPGSVSLGRLTAADLLYDNTDVRLLYQVGTALELYKVAITVPLRVQPQEEFITFMARQ